MPDERLEPVKQLSPPWNDLREQRLLQRIQDEKRARLAAPKRSPRLVWAAAAVALIGAGGIGIYAKTHRAPAPVASVVVPDASKMMLADGSEAVLSPDARVQIEQQSDDQVRIAQTAGIVRYDVVPNPKRTFAVKVGDVTVRVLGTAFNVALKDQKVTVSVDRGRVEVEAPSPEGTRKTELHVGESIQVAAYVSKELPVPSTTASTESEKKLAVPSVDQLLAKADEARAAHRYDEAATALRSLIQLHPADPRVASASFTLGRVERARGRHAAAAEAFARCYKAAPNGALAEDALAEEAVSWKSAGDAAKAKAAASKYLSLHPSGAHAQRMIPLTE